jgi:RNA polymerase sigma-70 factor (ECF subfamily)
MDDDFTILPRHELGRRSDEELLAYMRAAHARSQSGAVADAFDHLVSRHERRLRYLLHKMPKDRVEDLLQEVFLAAFEAIVADKRIDNFSAWVARVAHNTVVDFWRGKDGQQLKIDRSAASDDDADAGRSAVRAPAVDEGEFGEAEVWQLIDQLLDARSESHRAIVVLYVIQGRPAGEVAEATGESESNVYQVAKRFRDDLHRLLRGEDLDNDDPGPRREDRI